jgi:predicted amidohydrolase YtcJ
VTREQAWKGFTIDAAYAGFGEKLFGHLAPGLQADFIVVDRDPLLSSPTELRATVVLETWVGGQRVYRRSDAAKTGEGR